jgi:hypothetical protein
MHSAPWLESRIGEPHTVQSEEIGSVCPAREAAEIAGYKGVLSGDISV